jgi:hypothetical protein
MTQVIANVHFFFFFSTLDVKWECGRMPDMRWWLHIEMNTNFVCCWKEQIKHWTDLFVYKICDDVRANRTYIFSDADHRRQHKFLFSSFCMYGCTTSLSSPLSLSLLLTKKQTYNCRTCSVYKMQCKAEEAEKHIKIAARTSCCMCEKIHSYICHPMESAGWLVVEGIVRSVNNFVISKWETKG